MCKACNDTGKVHEYAGMGIVRVLPCACHQSNEDRFEKLLERFGLDDNSRTEEKIFQA